MTNNDAPDGGSRHGGAPLPATLLPLVYDPDTGRVYWLATDRRVVSTRVDTDGHTSFAAATPIPLPTTDADRLDGVRTLLSDIATYTCRPLPLPIAAPDPHGHDEYAVVWVDNSYDATTPREAAEQAWRTIRRPGSQACLFQVVNRRTGQRVEVDLLDDESDPRGASESDTTGAQP